MMSGLAKLAFITASVLASFVCVGLAEAGTSLVTSSVPQGWVHNKQRVAFYNGSDYFLVYLDSSSNIVAKASSDNVTWSGVQTLASDNLSAFNTFDVHLVEHRKVR
jgi:hypothetical protein